MNKRHKSNMHILNKNKREAKKRINKTMTQRKNQSPAPIHLPISPGAKGIIFAYNCTLERDLRAIFKKKKYFKHSLKQEFDEYQSNIL